MNLEAIRKRKCDKEDDVLERRQLGQSLRAIGRDYGLSGERIRQIEAKALEKIRQNEKSNQLKNY
ncbi:hypothetical protein IIC45_01275 [Patescibacteria group bacterium]|nr:hypothetical protein [Patescibacteria group bacterium]